MGTGKQRNITILNRQVFHRVDHFAPVRQHHVLACSLQHQRVGQVVDIFRSTGEVNKFRYRMQGRDGLYFFFQEILNRFYVVIGGAFNGFDARGIFFTKLSNNFIKVTDCVCVKSRNFLDRCVRGQFLQPTYFDLYAEFQQTKFAENSAQSADFVAVTSINGGNGGQ